MTQGLPQETNIVAEQQFPQEMSFDKGAYYGAIFSSTFNLNPSSLMSSSDIASQFKRQGKKLSVDEANAQYSIPGALSFKNDISEPEAAYRQRLKNKELEEKRIIGSVEEEGRGNAAASLGIGFVASMLDPISLASNFIPGVEGARALPGVGKLGIVKSIAGNRVLSGAIDGAIGAAVLEPLVLGGAKDLNYDYSIFDSATNIGFGTVMGGSIHGLLGLIDNARGKKFISPEADSTAQQVAMSQLLQDKNVNIQPIIEADRSSKNINLEERAADRKVNRREVAMERILTSPDEVKLLLQKQAEGKELSISERKQLARTETPRPMVENQPTKYRDLKSAYDDALNNPSSEISQLPVRDGLERMGFEVKTNKDGGQYAQLGNVRISLSEMPDSVHGLSAERKSRIAAIRASKDFSAGRATDGFSIDSNRPVIDKFQTEQLTGLQDAVDNRSLNEGIMNFQKEVANANTFDDLYATLSKHDEMLSVLESENSAERAALMSFFNKVENQMEFRDNFLELSDQIEKFPSLTGLSEEDLYTLREQGPEALSQIKNFSPDEANLINRLANEVDLSLVDNDLLKGIMAGERDSIAEAYDLAKFYEGAKSPREIFEDSSNISKKLSEDPLANNDPKIAQKNSAYEQMAQKDPFEFAKDLTLEDGRIQELISRRPALGEDIRIAMEESNLEIKRAEMRETLLEDALFCISGGGR